jgi:hypothetical protein
MKYDFEAMEFDIEAARRGQLGFIKEHTPEGGNYWLRVMFGEIPRSEYQPKIDAMSAQWERENETGTLLDLNVKPGDVVECVGWSDSANDTAFVGCRYTIMERHPDGRYEGLCAVRDGGWMPVHWPNAEMLFRIISRAPEPDASKLWRDMTPKEREMSAVMECIEYVDEVFDSEMAQRAREQLGIGLKRETVTLYSADGLNWSPYFATNAKWAQTYDLIDGKPDLDSIKMEEL